MADERGHRQSGQDADLPAEVPEVQSLSEAPLAEAGPGLSGESREGSSSVLDAYAASTAEIMWRAAVELQAADSSAEVARALLEWAIRSCGAESAIWWEQTGDEGHLLARRASGVRLVGRSRVFCPQEGFWQQTDGSATPVVTLSSNRDDHAVLLSRVGADRAMMVRAHDGERFVGALSVHGGGSLHGAASFLVALAQQAAAALRARADDEGRRQLAEGHRLCLAELGHALGSVLNLSELLTAVCRLALRTAQADACYLLLSEDQGPALVRAQEDRRACPAPLEPASLSRLAEEIASAYPGEAWWEPGTEHGSMTAGFEQAGVRSVLGLPLPIRGEALGALVLMSERENAFPALGRETLVALAAQSAVAIENLQLFEDMQRRLLEMADLTWVSTHIAATPEAERIASIIAEGAAKALAMPRAAVLLAKDKGALVPVPSGCVGVPHDQKAELHDGGHVGMQALESGRVLAVEDVPGEGYGGDALAQWLEARSLLCAPMLTQRGLRGVLAVGDVQPRRFSTHAKALLAAYANQGGLALQSALLHQDVVRHLGDLSELFELSQKLAVSSDLKEALGVVLQYACHLLRAPAGMIMLFEPKTRELTVKAAHGFSAQSSLVGSLRLKPGEGLAGKAAQSGVLLTSQDVCRDGRFRYRDVARQEGLRSGIAVPLTNQGRVVGVLNLYRLTAEDFTEGDQQLATAIGNSAALAVENAHLRQEAQERSQFLAALMSEINRRVRNSLQSVAGLLRMELKRPRHLSAEQAVNRGIAHIQTVAVVHELMSGREFQFVDVKQVARRVLDLTREAVPGSAEVGTRVTGTRVMLPSQKATGVALVLGELVDNALRHGLASAKAGSLTISLAETGSEVVVQVKDNGVGLPPSFDLDKSPGLGLRIAQGVVERDLGGSLEIESHLPAEVSRPAAPTGATVATDDLAAPGRGRRAAPAKAGRGVTVRFRLPK